MQSDFLTLDNPDFDLSALKVRKQPVTPTQQPSLLSMTLREVLVIQPPLGPNERLPRSLLIMTGLPALSAKPLPNYSFKSGIHLYMHPSHDPMYELAFAELCDGRYRTTHGTFKTLRLGCTGPLCRRIRNVSRFQAARLRDARTNSQQSYSHLQTMQDRYRGLVRSQPIYASVEPLLEALTFWAHEITPPADPNHLSNTYIRLSHPNARHSYLHSVYTDAVTI